MASNSKSGVPDAQPTISLRLEGLEQVLADVARRAADEALAARAEQTEGFLDVDSAASFLNTTPAAIRALVRRRQIPFIKLPTGAIRFDHAELTAWARSAG